MTDTTPLPKEAGFSKTMTHDLSSEEMKDLARAVLTMPVAKHAAEVERLMKILESAYDELETLRASAQPSVSADMAKMADERAQMVIAFCFDAQAIALKAQQEAFDAKRVCAQAYQVVGSLLSDIGQFGTDMAEKILDNLNEARPVHEDVLPWPSFDLPNAPVDLTPGERAKRHADRICDAAAIDAARGGAA